MHAILLRLLFFPPRKERFVSYTEIDGEMSFILDTEALGLFDLPANERWGLIKVDDGPLGFEESGIVAALAVPLGDAGMPLFYLSTFLTDYALVPHASLGQAYATLQTNSSFILPAVPP